MIGAVLDEWDVPAPVKVRRNRSGDFYIETPEWGDGASYDEVADWGYVAKKRPIWDDEYRAAMLRPTQPRARKVHAGKSPVAPNQFTTVSQFPTPTVLMWPEAKAVYDANSYVVVRIDLPTGESPIVQYDLETLRGWRAWASDTTNHHGRWTVAESIARG